MPTISITMRRIRETLRLHLQAGLNYSEVGGALKISKSVVGKYILLAGLAGVDCAVAQIFVATLGASNHAFACATPRQTTADWIGAQAQALEFIGGSPKLLVPDQPRALIETPDNCDPEPNPTYDEFARHCNRVVLPARLRRPRDKPKVEGSVLLVQRWILARQRNRRFFSRAELNAAIAELLADLNQRPFKRLPGCRRSAFELLDAPPLQPLPATRFVIGRWKTAKVNID